MDYTNVTIAVVPRQHFSHTARTIESIYLHTPSPFNLVCVDAGSPLRVARHLRDQARQTGFVLMRYDHYLLPNEARNKVLSRLETKYVVFIDNNMCVFEGWLDALVKCAEETGAWMVGSLVLTGSPGSELIHYAGGVSHIEKIGERRLFIDKRPLADKRLQDVAPLQRTRSEMVEFHCALIRADCFERVGKFDEELTLFSEKDFSMCVRAEGGEIYFEPKAMVRMEYPARLTWSDMPYFLLRWSEARNERSFKHFRQKWQLANDDPVTEATRKWGTDVRQSLFWPIRPFFRGRGYWLERRLLVPLDLRINRYIPRLVGRGDSYADC